MRTQRRFSLLAFGVTVGLVGCGDSDDPDGGTPQDSGPVVDSGEPVDGGVEPDAGSNPDGGMPDAGGQPPDIRIPGLAGPVRVQFDDLGVAHIRCQSDNDCFAAQGYFHAAHRFGQMDLRRRVATGRLAELVGGIASDADVSARLFVATSSGANLFERAWNAANADTQAAVTAYTAGVNAWIADLRAGRNGAQLSQEYAAQPLAAIADWDQLDSVASAIAIVESLTNESDSEIEAGLVFATLNSTVAFDLYSPRPASPSTILPQLTGLSDRGTFSRARLLDEMAELRGRLALAKGVLGRAPVDAFTPALRYGSRGSNNWVVAPARTANGLALMANDPHLTLDNPSVWYMASLDSKTSGTGTLHTAGASFAGFPGIFVGQNESLAWGVTTSFFDFTDVYIETLTPGGDGVLFNGTEVPFVEVQQTIAVSDGPDVQANLQYVPHHGPVVSIDTNAGTAVTIRWTGHEITTDLNFVLGLMRATTVEEARTAFEEITTFGQNLVVADADGNIGWYPYNRLPSRPWASAALAPWLPLPGTGEAEWGPPIPYAQLPQATNPPAGYVATANNDMTGALADGDPTNDGELAFQAYLAAGYRHERIEQLLSATSSHTPASMSAIQADTRILLAERTMPSILDTIAPSGLSLSPAAQRVFTAISDWDYRCPTGLMNSDPNGAKDPDLAEAASSIGCTAFHVLWPRLVDATFADEVEPQGFAPVQGLPTAMVLLLTDPDRLLGGNTYWDNVSTTSITESRFEIVFAAFEDAAVYLEQTFSADPDDWRWGRIHTVTLRAPFIGDLIDNFNLGPFANDGGLFSVDVANPDTFSDEYDHRAGPSVRVACEVGPATTCRFDLPGGQRNIPGQSYYGNLLPPWLDNAPSPLHFTPTDIDQAAVDEQVLRAP